MLFDRNPELVIAAGPQVKEVLSHLSDVLIRARERWEPAQTVAGRQSAPEQDLGLPDIL